MKCFHYWDSVENLHDGIFWSMIKRPEFKTGAEQYTGLKDSNGVEIYESDIILYKRLDGEKELTIIDYHGDMFHCKSVKYKNLSPGNYRLTYVCLDNNVIGNIHQNPELLEGK
jgi:uncharacterized phage protein (TIGR01671 family)